MDIYSDGGSRGNPGFAASAFVVIGNDGKVLHQESKYLGITTNNVAEYQGVVLALNWVISEAWPTTLVSKSTNYSNNIGNQINFYLDSELVVKQLNGLYRVKDLNLKKLFTIAKNLEKEIATKIVFQHVPRSKNIQADQLVNQELDRIS